MYLAKEYLQLEVRPQDRSILTQSITYLILNEIQCHACALKISEAMLVTDEIRKQVLLLERSDLFCDMRQQTDWTV